jgi:hypothetical protein
LKFSVSSTKLYSLYRNGRGVCDEVDVLNSLIIKALSSFGSKASTSQEEQIIDECLEFLKEYCKVLQSWTCLSPTDIESIIPALFKLAFPLAFGNKIKMNKGVNHSHKKRADLNIMSETSKPAKSSTQEAALEVLISLLMNCQDSLNESHFEAISEAVIQELLIVGDVKDANKLMVSSFKHRKLLLHVLQSLVHQTAFPAKRPIAPSVKIFQLFSNDPLVADLAMQYLTVMPQILKANIGLQAIVICKNGIEHDSDKDLDFGETENEKENETHDQVMEETDKFDAIASQHEISEHNRQNNNDQILKETEKPAENQETSFVQDVINVDDKLSQSYATKVSQEEKKEAKQGVITLDAESDDDHERNQKSKKKRVTEKQVEKTEEASSSQSSCQASLRRSSRLAKTRKDSGSESAMSEDTSPNPKKKVRTSLSKGQVAKEEAKTTLKIEDKISEKDEDSTEEPADILALGSFE